MASRVFLGFPLNQAVKAMGKQRFSRLVVYLFSVFDLSLFF
jgi:hypothetical protein